MGIFARKLGYVIHIIFINFLFNIVAEYNKMYNNVRQNLNIIQGENDGTIT